MLQFKTIIASQNIHVTICSSLVVPLQVVAAAACCVAARRSHLHRPAMHFQLGWLTGRAASSGARGSRSPVQAGSRAMITLHPAPACTPLP